MGQSMPLRLLLNHSLSVVLVKDNLASITMYLKRMDRHIIALAQSGGVGYHTDDSHLISLGWGYSSSFQLLFFLCCDSVRECERSSHSDKFSTKLSVHPPVCPKRIFPYVVYPNYGSADLVFVW